MSKPQAVTVKTAIPDLRFPIFLFTKKQAGELAKRNF